MGGYRCYDSESEWLAELSVGGESVRSRKALVRADGDAVVETAEGSVVAMIAFDRAEFSQIDGTLAFEVPYGCDNDPDIDWLWYNVASAWNDRIGSVKGYSNCGNKLFEHVGYGGAEHGWHTDAAHLGVMNNETSSVKMR